MKILFIGTPQDKQYLPRLKALISGRAQVSYFLEPLDSLEMLAIKCSQVGITNVATTSAVILSKLLRSYSNNEKASLDNFAGSIFHYKGIEFLILNPLEHLVKVSYADFIFTNYLRKFIDPSSYRFDAEFDFTVFMATEQIPRFDNCQGIAVDIETVQDNLRITSIAFSFIYLSDTVSIKTLVLTLDSPANLAAARQILASPPPKIFQNGKYDLAYLSRYNAIPYNYLWDTATMFHCWYAELPKDLASLAAFFIRDTINWKGLAQSGDLLTQLEYNARDTHNTALVFLNWISAAPDWAKRNYQMEFPLTFPTHLCEMTGLKVDAEAKKALKNKKESEASTILTSLQNCIGYPDFNPASPKQVLQLAHGLGHKDMTSTDSKKDIPKIRARHPLSNFLFGKIAELRKLNKLISSYLKDFEYCGRVLFSLVPHGTDTGRLASKEHHFWCGIQFQNIPRDPEYKQIFVSDPGFLIGEADYAQAESRGTAYISGDTALIANVESPKDFHTLNCCAFFGVKYEEVTCPDSGKTLNKSLRDLAKRVNHGANYNMGPGVLLETMGDENVLKAKKLLNLPKQWTLKKTCEHLLEQFHKAYPAIKKNYYEYVKAEIQKTKMLVGATGWTRYCFGKPWQSKMDLNSYVAHCPQSLNAMLLNQAFLKVFYNVYLPNHKNFKLICQIHDSILFQYRVGHEYLAEEVKKNMEFPTRIVDVNGTARTMLVPVDLKIGSNKWGA